MIYLGRCNGVVPPIVCPPCAATCESAMLAYMNNGVWPDRFFGLIDPLWITETVHNTFYDAPWSGYPVVARTDFPTWLTPVSVMGCWQQTQIGSVVTRVVVEDPAWAISGQTVTVGYPTYDLVNAAGTIHQRIFVFECNTADGRMAVYFRLETSGAYETSQVSNISVMALAFRCT